MADQDKHDKTSDELNDIDQEGYVGELLKEIYSSLDTTIDRKNQAITDLEAVKTDVATNNAKVGITTSQASAITTNTAKTGITSAQATAISTSEIARFKKVATNNSKITADVSLVVSTSKTTTTLQTQVTLSDGSKFTGTLATLTKGK